jgi:hypothetical protein
MIDQGAAMPVFELVLFQPKPGVSAAAFDAAVAESSRFLARQPGFLGREVGVSVDGEYADIVRWADLDAALRAAEQFVAASEAREFNGLLERESVRVWHFRTVKRTPPGDPAATS